MRLAINSLVAPHTQQLAPRCHCATPRATVVSMLPTPRYVLHSSLQRRSKPCGQGQSSIVVHASNDNEPAGQQAVPFGYTRKDVILIGTGLIGLGYAMYYGLQATGMDAGMAGNFVQLIIFLGICIGWIGSYLFRVANKQMTYVQQLKDYEEAVMVKRLEELPPGEQSRLMEEVEGEHEQREARRKAWQEAQKKQEQ